MPETGMKYKVCKRKGEKTKKMDDGYTSVSMLLLAGFILLDAVCYGFGAAIQNVNTGNLEKEAEEGNRKAEKLLRIVEHPARIINTIQITSHLVGIVTGAYVLGQFRKQFAGLISQAVTIPGQWASMVSLVVMTLILVMLLISFGIVIPKCFAVRNPEKWCYAMLPWVTGISVIAFPVTSMISGISYVVLKLFGINMYADSENVTEEDIMSMVNEGHEQGVLEADEAEMITNIFELNDKEACDIMTHRTNISALESSMTLEEAVSYILKEGNNSRYPVFTEDIDNIIGILHLRDAVVYAEEEANKSRSLEEIPGLLREAHFTPETRNVDKLFEEMQSRKIHMEIVVDEYGQTAGIVTMEDILEEIVGNIMDEYDVEEEFILAQPDGSYIIDGLTPLDEAAAALDVEFDESDYENYDTMNGLIVSKLHHLPEEGERYEVECSGYLFYVLKVENKVIQSIRAVKLPEKEQEDMNQAED